MALVVVVLLAALAVGRLAGGTLARLGALPVRSRRLVLLALLAQLLGVLVGGPAHPLGLGLSAALVVAFLARNRGLHGTGLVALGLLANALVVAANGAMPVSADAAARAGVGTADLRSGADPRHVLAGPDTRLRWLSDVVPVPLPAFPQVLSPGDVLVAAGVGQLVVAGMLRPRPLPALPGERGRPPRAPAVPLWRPSRHEEEPHGQACPQASLPQEERGEPRQAAERLTVRAPDRPSA